MMYRSHARWLFWLLTLTSCSSRATRLDAASDGSIDSAPGDAVVDVLPSSDLWPDSAAPSALQTIYLHTGTSTRRDPLLVVEPAGSARLGVFPSASASEVVMLESDGSERWRTPLGCPNALIQANALVLDDQGRTAVGGVVANVTTSDPCPMGGVAQTLSLNDGLMLQLDAKGLTRWATVLRGDQLSPSTIDIVVEDNVIVGIGDLRGEMTIGQISLAATTKHDQTLWIAGFELETGTTRWALAAGSSRECTGTALTAAAGKNVQVLATHGEALTLGSQTLAAARTCDEWLVPRAALATLAVNSGEVLGLEHALQDAPSVRFGCVTQAYALANSGARRCIGGTAHPDTGFVVDGLTVKGTGESASEIFIVCGADAPAAPSLFQSGGTAFFGPPKLLAGHDGALYLTAAVSDGTVRLGKMTYWAPSKPSSFLLLRLDPATGAPTWSLFLRGLPRASVGVDAQGIITLATRVNEGPIELDGRRIEANSSGHLVVWRFRPLP